MDVIPMRPELRFPAMGTQVHLVATGATPAALEAARRLIVDCEQRWSRLLPDSELSALNRQAGEWVTLSESTYALVDAAIAGWRMTDGRFDPTVLPALVRAGYDRSFDAL